MINQWPEKAQTARLCKLLDVSRSGFYAARQRRRRPRTACTTMTTLAATFHASGCSYGSRRLRAALHAQGVKVGRYRVRSLMRQQGLQARWKREFVHTTNSRHGLPVADNVQPSIQSIGTGSGLDVGYHLRAHPQWLALSGGGDGSVLAQDRWLGDGANHAG